MATETVKSAFSRTFLVSSSTTVVVTAVVRVVTAMMISVMVYMMHWMRLVMCSFKPLLAKLC